MSDTPSTTESTEFQLPQDIEQLVAAIEELPERTRHNLQPILVRVIQSTRRRRRILQLVQDALGQLRLDMKYLMFDLEATRRERDAFRRKLEGEPG